MGHDKARINHKVTYALRLITEHDGSPVTLLTSIRWATVPTVNWVSGLLLIFYFSHGVRMSPRGTAATVWTIVPAPDDDDDDECGAIGGMRIGRGNEVLGENLPQCHFVYHKSYMT
jgi:hypothetical protein